MKLYLAQIFAFAGITAARVVLAKGDRVEWADVARDARQAGQAFVDSGSAMAKGSGETAMKRLKWCLMATACEVFYFLDQKGMPTLALYYKALNTCCAIGWDLYGRPTRLDHQNVWESWT